MRQAPNGARWCPYDLKRKRTTDLRNAGASAKERCALVGHADLATNQIYESVQPQRLREIVDGMTLTLHDAPLPHEIAVICAYASRGRLNHRVGGIAADKIAGIDGLT